MNNSYDIRKEPQLGFYDDGQTIDKLVKAALSEEYWIFIFASMGSGLTIMNKIEWTYYKPNTDANADFGLIFSLSMGYVIAKKSRMSRRQLAEILFSYPMPPEKRRKGISDFVNVRSESDNDVIPMTFGNEKHLNLQVLKAVADITDFFEKVRTGT